MDIITTCIVCVTVYACVHRITKTGLQVCFKNDTTAKITELPEEAVQQTETSLDSVLAEIYDAFGLSSGIDKEDAE